MYQLGFFDAEVRSNGPLLTKAVKINQSDGIPGSGITGTHFC